MVIKLCAEFKWFSELVCVPWVHLCVFHKQTKNCYVREKTGN